MHYLELMEDSSSNIFDSLIGGALLSFNVKDNNYNYYEYPLVGMHWLWKCSDSLSGHAERDTIYL